VWGYTVLLKYIGRSLTIPTFTNSLVYVTSNEGNSDRRIFSSISKSQKNVETFRWQNVGENQITCVTGNPLSCGTSFVKREKPIFTGKMEVNLGRILSHEVIALRFSVLKTEDEDSQIEIHITISTSPLNPIPSALFERSQRG
jgi:hypothetical protein